MRYRFVAVVFMSGTGEPAIDPTIQAPHAPTSVTPTMRTLEPSMCRALR